MIKADILEIKYCCIKKPKIENVFVNISSDSLEKLSVYLFGEKFDIIELEQLKKMTISSYSDILEYAEKKIRTKYDSVDSITLDENFEYKLVVNTEVR